MWKFCGNLYNVIYDLKGENYFWDRRDVSDCYNHVHDILRGFDGEAKLPFTASETKRDYW